MKKNKSTKWITIPEKGSAQTKKLEQTDKSTRSSQKTRLVDRVDHKFFWGTGFVAVLIFGSMLISPQFYSNLKAQLFDGSFEVVPSYEEQQQAGAFFGGDESEESEEVVVEGSENESADPDETNQNSSEGVEANVEAVTVQVDPINADNQEAVQNDASEEQELSSENENESEVESENSETAKMNAELQTLIQSLSNQLEELKKQGRLKDEQIQALSDELSSQQAAFTASQEQQAVLQSQNESENSLRPAASDEPEKTDPSSTPYRLNANTVTMDPSTVLAQNQSSDQMSQVNTEHSSNIQAETQTDQSELNASLANLDENSETGPFDALLLAFFLASVGMLGYGTLRAVRLS